MGKLLQKELFMGFFFYTKHTHTYKFGSQGDLEQVRPRPESERAKPDVQMGMRAWIDPGKRLSKEAIGSRLREE